jgi:hypothetical protein
LRALLASIVLALVVIAAPRPCEATSLRLGLGAHYWLSMAGLFDFNLAIEAPIARSLSVGGRFGAGITASPTDVVIPLDLLFDVHLSRLYLEIAAGPWIFVDSGSAVRAHFSFGFGLDTGSITFGPEIGYLDPRGIIGVRLGFRI